MKNAVIADSSGLISIFSPNDSNHDLAIRVSKKIAQDNQTVCIPSDIFSETLNVVGKKISQDIAYIIGSTLLQDTRFLIIDVTAAILQDALKILQKQPASVSYTDCVVMAAANSLKTKEIFGFDKVFHKSGYIRIGLDDGK